MRKLSTFESSLFLTFFTLIAFGDACFSNQGPRRNGRGPLADPQCRITQQCTTTPSDFGEKADENECLAKCKSSSACQWYNYYALEKLCLTFDDSECNLEDCPDCSSGQRGCDPDYECKKNYKCRGAFAGTAPANNYNACLQNCRNKTNCNWFTFSSSERQSCVLLRDCSSKNETASAWFSGQKECPDEATTTPSTTTPSSTTVSPSGSSWHMVIGGNTGGEFHKTVEMYNPEKGKNCTLEDIPNGLYGHSGFVLNDIPIYCGGKTENFVLETFCYQYTVANSSWTQISSELKSSVLHAGNGIVYNETAYLFGGEGSTLTTSQKYKTEWELGDSLYQPSKANGHCIVTNANNTKAYFMGFGGRSDAHTILILDLATMNFTVASKQLTGQRYLGACALGSDGGIYIAGGCCQQSKSQGMEVYYPDNNTVITISDKLPQETTVDSLYSAQMVSYGDKLVLYGGKVGLTSYDLVYEYDVTAQNWTQRSSMTTARGNHVVLSVPDSVVAMAEQCQDATTTVTTESTTEATEATSGSTDLTSSVPTEQTSGPTDQTSSGPTDQTSSGPTEQTSSGPTEQTSSGPTEQTSSGPTEQTSGPTDQTSSGPTEQTSSGPTDQTSGPTDQTSSGPTEQTSSGPTDQTSGSTDQTAETTEQTSSGPTEQTSGPTEPTFGPTDQTSGSTDQTSGSTEPTSGPTDQTSGSTDQTSGPTDQTSSPTDQTSEPPTSTSTNCETEGFTCSEDYLAPDIVSTYEECRVGCSTFTACKFFTFYKNEPDENCFYFGETCSLDTKCTTPSTECTTGNIDCEGVNC